jgi:cysteine synthase A
LPVLNTVLEAIGRTPMVRLRRLPEKGSAEILVKVESLNPGGSIKARPALRMVEEAEKSGALRTGSIIVEASSGNQGIALAMIGAVKGYKVVVFMPESMSAERRKVLKAYGAEVRLTPVGKDIRETLEICIHQSREFAEKTPGAFRARQFENPDNCCAHEDTTAREILEQTGGKLDVFIAGIGTGGTITGTGRVLKRAIPGLKVVVAEPDKASLLVDVPFGFHAQEGIGDGVLPDILDKSVIDRAILVSDEQAIGVARRLAREEGIFCGVSSGTNVYAALKVAKEIGESKRVVTVIPDGGEKYLSTALFEKVEG